MSTTATETAEGRATNQDEPRGEHDTPARVNLTLSDRPEFRIDSESAANWLLRKLAAIGDEKKRIKAQTAKRIEELDADHNRLMSRFGAELEAWAREESARRRRKTITLQQGCVAFRTVPARLEIEDAGTAFDIARTLGLALKLDPAAYRRHAQQALTDTGEILPGLVLVDATEKFSVRFPSDEKEASDPE